MFLSSLSTKKIVVAGFVIIFVGLCLVWWKRYEMVTSQRTGQTKSEPETVSITTKDGEKILTLMRSRKYEVTAPDSLIAEKKKGEVISLTHSVPYNHVDPCDFVGDSGKLAQLTDFNVEVGVGGTLRETMERFGGKYIVGEFFKAGKDVPTLEKGYIEEVTIGKYKGYAVTSQVEGCGNTTYYIPLDKETLVFKRKIISELSPLYSNYSAARKIPGVIKPDEEEEIFRSLIASINVQ